MIRFLAVLSATLSVLPSDRMAMADRLFDRAQYAEAKAEYLAVEGSEGVKADELLFRLAECDRMLGVKLEARRRYGELLERYPLSRHANRARFHRALCGTDDEAKAEFKLLDSDSVPADVRAAALYHVGVLASDASALARSVRMDPKGRYAPYAKFRHAQLTVDSPDFAVSRAAIGELMEIHFGSNKELGRQALHLAAAKSYALKRYGEASSLFRRYLKLYPQDANAEQARIMAAWSDYLVGKYSDAAALCGEAKSDDLAYLLAASAYATGDMARAKELMHNYLERFPHGRYRKAVELPLARMAFDSAEKASNTNGVIEAARRSVALSGAAADRLRLAWALERGGFENDAANEYTTVARDFPSTDDAAEALFRKAMIELRAKKWSAADLSLAEALKTGKNARRKAESLYWRGIAAFQTGHAVEGSKFLAEALELGLSLDQSREARLCLADADLQAGRIKQAKEAYARLVREGATERMSAAKLHSVGKMLVECKDGEEAFAEAKLCAQALLDGDKSAEWRQAGFLLRAEAEEAAGEYSAALESYRLGFAEKVRTQDCLSAALAYGTLLSRDGRHTQADEILKEAVKLNSANPVLRARAYLALSRNCQAMTDYRGAVAYATVVLTLFDDSELSAQAKKIIAEHPEVEQ